MPRVSQAHVQQRRKTGDQPAQGPRSTSARRLAFTFVGRPTALREYTGTGVFFFHGNANGGIPRSEGRVAAARGKREPRTPAVSQRGPAAQTPRISSALSEGSACAHESLPGGLRPRRSPPQPDRHHCHAKSRLGRQAKPDQATSPGVFSNPPNAVPGGTGHQRHRQKGVGSRRQRNATIFPESPFRATAGRGTIKTLTLILIRVYQVGISPILGPSCRFYPTCSEYARKAIWRHGLRRGGLLALRRICKCHPFHPGGVDPVP